MEDNCFESLIPDHVLRLQPYVAGKPIWEVQREYGLTEVIKLASNENSLGPSPKAIAAAQACLAQSHRYPDVAGLELRTELAKRYNVKVDNVVLGSGSEGIMSCIMRTFLDTEDEVVSVHGTFVGFTVMARARSTAPILKPLKDYHFDLQLLADSITERTKIVYLCNPNNPTGTFFEKSEFDAFLERLPKRVLVILDEAYFEFAKDIGNFPNSMDYRHDQVITLRTFSKAYGLAGLRIGYGIAHEYLIKNLMKVKLPFEPSSAAQAAGLAALGDEEFLQKSLEINNKGRAYLQAQLGNLGLRYLPTASNFICVVMENAEQVNQLTQLMLQKGVIIRPLGGFALPWCFRVTIGLESENQRCIEALKATLSEMGLAH